MDDKPPQSAKDRMAERSSAIEGQIREQQKRREERAFLEELAKRISVAREGKMRTERGEYPEALACFRKFFAITARAMNSEPGEMTPAMLEDKQRSAESLLISSIALDMLKILDKLDTDSAREERRAMHRIFIRFTVNQNFQNFAAENLRKFIVYRKTIRNKQEFWVTYQAIKVKRMCVVATWAFASADAPEVARLRAFRNRHLYPHPAGRALANTYYRHGETLVLGLSALPGARGATRQCLRWICRWLPSERP